AATSGGLVTSVPDSSGNGYTLVGTAGHQPALNASDSNFNGHASATFSSAGTTFLKATSIANTGAASVASFFFLVIRVGANATQRMINWGSAVANIDGSHDPTYQYTSGASVSAGVAVTNTNF